jgi:bud site selection protein 20
MGGVQKRKRNHKNIRDTYRKYRLKRRTKDIDQIHEDLKPENADKLKAQPIDPDLPGLGQHYCVHCAYVHN